jgi:NRAMP (natural resistance-associated macrophage protein)-like metal ion transporter
LSASTGGPGAAPPRRRLRLREIGPGAVVAAAFIGPGTVTTATLAGARYGYALLWALAFSIVATLVLQEMAARLGLVTGSGLGEAMRARFTGGSRVLAIGLVIGAVVIGNAAYETGNLLGAGLGMNGVLGGGTRAWALGFAAVASALLWTGRYRLIERLLVAMVVLMSVVFLATAIVLAPSLGGILRGFFVPSLPGGSAALFVAVGLIGTTVVPYNLFLHAVAVRERWSDPSDLPAVRADATIAIVLGGLVSASIVITSAAALQHGAVEVSSAGDMAAQLEPLLGGWARAFFALGLLAAGLTSAITAPLAAAYAAAGALGWARELRGRRMRLVWGLVLLSGAVFAATGVRPIPAILFAQVANGVLLPLVAVFLLVAANDARMGRWRNGPLANVVGAVVVLTTLVLGVWAVWRAVSAI